MAELKTHKFVSALPGTLEADSIYFVRTGEGFDLFVTNSGGTIVSYSLNLPQELILARGGRSTLEKRLNVLSNVSSPNAIPSVVGRWYDGSFHAANPGTLAGAVDRFDLGLFFSSQALRADRLAISVTTAVASSLVKIVVYDSSDDGVPDNLLFESPALDCSTTGGKETIHDITFEANRMYWLGIRHNSTPTLRSIVGTSALNMGMASSNSSTQLGTLRRSLAFTAAAPAQYNYQEDEAVFALCPSVRLRARSLT